MNTGCQPVRAGREHVRQGMARRGMDTTEYEKNTKGHDNRHGPKCTQERQYQ